MKKAIHYLLLAFFMVLLLFSSWKLVSALLSYKEGQDSYASLEQYVSFEIVATEPLPSEQTEEPIATETEETDKTPWPKVDFEQLEAINPDVVGWICIEGTNINYPVVQGEDNDYYLSHLFDRSANSSGSIFLDSYCAPDFTDSHSILYGHHMKDKTMFYSLMEYKDQAFYDTHTEGMLITPQGNYRIRFFSGYVSDTWSNAWERDFVTNDFETWLQDIAERSCFSSPYAPVPGDNIVTLSTCSYEFETAKFVLHGYIAEREEETEA